MPIFHPWWVYEGPFWHYSFKSNWALNGFTIHKTYGDSNRIWYMTSIWWFIWSLRLARLVWG